MWFIMLLKVLDLPYVFDWLMFNTFATGLNEAVRT